MRAPVTYVENFVDDVTARLQYKILLADENWIAHEGVPRRELYHNDNPAPYLYGRPEFARTYLPTAWNPVATLLREMINTEFGVDYDVCFSNMYRDGRDQLGWHADDSPEMDDDFPIMIVSLYPDEKTLREIWFRTNLANAGCPVCSAKSGEEHNTVCSMWANRVVDNATASQYRAGTVEHLMLGNGSLAIMAPHMQETHEHRIPKSNLNACGPRISLTFRKYKVVVCRQF